VPNGGHIAPINKTPHWVTTRLRHMHLVVGQEITLHGHHFAYRVRVVSEQQGHKHQIYDIERYALYPPHVHHRHHFNRRYSITVLIVVIVVALIIGIWLGNHR